MQVPRLAPLARDDKSAKEAGGRLNSRLLQGAGFLQDRLREVVLHLSLVADDLVIRRLQQLLLAVAKLLANGLLHARILQLALTGSFLADEPYHAVTEDLMTVGVGDHQH